MPVTRPLLSCSPFLSFQSALRASGQSCAQCPSFLHSLHFVQLEKVMFIRRTQSTFVRCSCCPTTASCISLSLFQRLVLRVLVRPAAVVLQENSRGRGEFQCIQLGYWVDGCFGGAGLTVFSCGKHKHTVGQSVLVVQTHTNRLSHFSFFLLLTFCTFHFSFLLTFCTFHFSFLLTFCTCFFFPSSFFSANFLEPTIYFL